MNHKDVRMISDDNISSSFEHVTGTRQYFHIMLLDVLSKIRQFGLCTFFLSCSAAKFHWVEILQVVARQCGETLTREQVNAMDWSMQVNYLKRNQGSHSKNPKVSYEIIPIFEQKL